MAASRETVGPERSDNGRGEGEVVGATPSPNDSFVGGLIARGEAARKDASGNLPPGATHEIIGETAAGRPIVVRRRFSAV